MNTSLLPSMFVKLLNRPRTTSRLSPIRAILPPFDSDTDRTGTTTNRPSGSACSRTSSQLRSFKQLPLNHRITSRETAATLPSLQGCGSEQVAKAAHQRLEERSHAARPHLESIFDAFDPLNDADIPSALDPLPDSDLDDLDPDLNGLVGEIEDPDTLVVIDDEVYQESDGNLAEVDVDSNVIGGTDEGDVLVGAPDDNVIYGGDGNDDATGKSGVDLLIGGGDQDRLRGNDGGDLLVGGEWKPSTGRPRRQRRDVRWQRQRRLERRPWC